jgi:serine/threonine-protein kinase
MGRLDVDAARFERLNRLLDTALALGPEERERWLGGLGGEDVALVPRLRELLAPAGPGGAPLGTLPRLDPGPTGTTAEEGESGRAGEVVGPYRLLRLVAEGGMGAVWLAERADGMVQRAVALKLPRGTWQRAALAERMGREREILASLNHPHIARLYDAGVTGEGQPWLALEYVEGRPIDAYLREVRPPLRDRLGLFLQVAAAVGHAHANLVVHRDLKPSNVLVTGDGQARLLDFGIAKLLAEGTAQETALTRLGGRALTPGYASPEQVAGRPIGVGSDVYSLGVVLYEMLTGSRPYRLTRESAAALEEAILQAEPARPSEVAEDREARRALRGDLDTIVLKALKKRPDERYATVNGFAEDVERWLAGRPVSAQPDSRGYRLRKFVLRNKLAVGAATAVAVAVLVGAGVAVWQARVAAAAGARAIREAEAARQAARVADANATLAGFLFGDLAAGRSTTDVERQLERALVVVRQEEAGDALVRAHLLMTLSGKFRQFGDQRRHRELADEAAAAAREAGEPVVEARLDCWRARDLSQAGEQARARALLDRALATLRGALPRSSGYLLACLADDSAIARMAGDQARALASIEEASEREVAGGLARTNTHADTLLVLARAHALAGRYRDGVEAARRSIALREQIGQGDTPGMVNVRSILATTLREGGRPAEALEIIEALIARHRERGGDPRTIAGLVYERAVTLLALGRAAAALPELAQAREAARSAGNDALTRGASMAEIVALVELGRIAEARAALGRAEPLYARLRADQVYVARLFTFAAARVALAEGDPRRARSALDEASEIVRRAGNDADPAWRPLEALLARAALLGGEASAAAAHAAAALALSRQFAIDPQGSTAVGEDLLLHAEALAAQGDAAGARRDAEAAIGHLSAWAGPHHPAIARARVLAR